MDSRRPLKCHSEILQTPPVYAKAQCTSWPLIHAITTEVYGTDKDRFAAVDIFYAIIVVEHLNNSCKCCWNNCFGVINLSVNYSLLGPLLYIAFCAQAWNVRKPYRNALLSTQGMTTVCSVTAGRTGQIIHHALPRRIGHPLCWVYTVTEQRLLINRGLGGALSLTSALDPAANWCLSVNVPPPSPIHSISADLSHRKHRHIDMPMNPHDSRFLSQLRKSGTLFKSIDGPVYGSWKGLTAQKARLWAM